MGDSHTYGFGVSRSEIWTKRAEELTGVQFINRGINGNTTGGMLAMLPAALDADRPDAVLLMGGSNDIMFGHSDAAARANMGAMAHIVCARQVAPLIGIPLEFCAPIRGDWAAVADLDVITPMRKVYSTWLRQMCQVFHFLPVDFEREFPRRVAQLGHAPLRSYYLDGLHVTPEGHRLMAQIIADTLGPLTRQQA